MMAQIVASMLTLCITIIIGITIILLMHYILQRQDRVRHGIQWNGVDRCWLVTSLATAQRLLKNDSHLSANYLPSLLSQVSAFIFSALSLSYIILIYVPSLYMLHHVLVTMCARSIR
jgi:hypothetical protein